MNYLYDTNRLRVAFSVSPENYFHLGHLKALAISKKLADKFGVEFHIRIDDIYAKTCDTWRDYPKVKIDKPNKHTPLPGRSIMEMRRPPFMTHSYFDFLKGVVSKFCDYDKMYTLSSVEHDVRNWLKGSWRSYLPIYFIEDVAWKKSHIVRGKEWDITGEHQLWVSMQIEMLNHYNSNYDIHLFENLLTEDGEKISKSNLNHYKYIWNEKKEKVWYNYWEKFFQEEEEK